MRADLRSVLALAASLCCAQGASAETTPAPSSPVKPFVLDQECVWWLSGDDGQRLRASIEGSYSDEDPVLTVADPVFFRIGESESPRVTLRIDGDRSRKIVLKDWSTHVGTETAMLGMYLTARARRILDGARRIEIAIGGELLLDLPVAAMPSAAELQACVFPKSVRSDTE